MTTEQREAQKGARDHINTAQSAVELTTSTGEESFDGAPYALYIGYSGNLSLKLAKDTDFVLFENVPVGVFPVCSIAIDWDATSATGIVVLYP